MQVCDVTPAARIRQIFRGRWGEEDGKWAEEARRHCAVRGGSALGGWGRGRPWFAQLGETGKRGRAGPVSHVFCICQISSGAPCCLKVSLRASTAVRL